VRVGATCFGPRGSGRVGFLHEIQTPIVRQCQHARGSPLRLRVLGTYRMLRLRAAVPDYEVVWDEPAHGSFVQLITSAHANEVHPLPADKDRAAFKICMLRNRYGVVRVHAYVARALQLGAAYLPPALPAVLGPRFDSAVPAWPAVVVPQPPHLSSSPSSWRSSAPSALPSPYTS